MVALQCLDEMKKKEAPTFRSKEQGNSLCSLSVPKPLILFLEAIFPQSRAGCFQDDPETITPNLNCWTEKDGLHISLGNLTA